jgi:hypothetical protein
VSAVDTTIGPHVRSSHATDPEMSKFGRVEVERLLARHVHQDQRVAIDVGFLRTPKSTRESTIASAKPPLLTRGAFSLHRAVALPQHAP